MTLYIKQHVFTWGDKFSVLDEDGNEKYYVEGEIFTFGRKLHVYDADSNEVAYIAQEVFAFMPRYKIYLNGLYSAEIKKEFTFFVPEYTVKHYNGREWNVGGDFFNHDYEVMERGDTLISINKEWLTWGDSYALQIDDSTDERLALAVVLAIDCVLASQN